MWRMSLEINFFWIKNCFARDLNLLPLTFVALVTFATLVTFVTPRTFVPFTKIR